MCYSAQVYAELRKFKRATGVDMDVEEYVRIFWSQKGKDPSGKRPKVPRAMEIEILRDGPERLAELVREWDDREMADLTQELFKQKKRVGDAERALQTKVTKKAHNDVRVGTDKMERTQGRIDALKRREPLASDSRMYPGYFVPIMVMQGGKRVLKPMRYQCRLPGWNELIERKYPGTYNARRDSIPKTWKDLFGVRHGIMIVNAFYENVERHKMEHRELALGEESENVVLEFRPRPEQDMLIACLWNESQEGDETLLSFAAITDEPAPEVADAGHDRTIIQIKAENVDRWLTPEGRSIAELHAILDDRPPAYYEHRLAKAA